MLPERRRSAVHEPEYKYLMQRMRDARTDAGMTQSEVADALDRPLSFVSKCELGERRIDPIDLQKLAILYDKPFEYFLPRTPKRRKKKKGS